MEELKRVFASIEENETNYDKRYGLVISAMHFAGVLGYPNYIRFDPEAPGWPVFCIELPGAGEVSWHMPSTQRDYTGYTTGSDQNNMGTPPYQSNQGMGQMYGPETNYAPGMDTTQSPTSSNNSYAMDDWMYQQ